MHLKKLNYWEVERKIAMLRSLAESKASPSKHLPLIKSIFNGVRTPAITVKNEIIYRSRWNKGTELYFHTNDLRYPDIKDVKKKGRLNDAGENVLYAAACELGTIIESRPDMNKLFTIASIKPLHPGILYFPLGITDKGYYDRNITAAEKLVIDYVNHEITKIVATSEDYNSTIALARFFLRTKISGLNNTGCIAYPSVESSKISSQTTYNFAIPPEVFDKFFVFTGATAYCLTNEEEHYQLNSLNEVSSFDQTGRLAWRYSKKEMLRRISQGLTLDGTYCENIKRLAQQKCLTSP